MIRPVRTLRELPQHALQILAELETLLDRHEAGEPVLFEEHRRHMLEATEGDLPGVVERAAFELRSFSRRQAPAVDRYDVKAVVLKECSGWTPTDVARSAHRVPAETLRKWRRADGRDPETGKPTDGFGDRAKAQRALSRVDSSEHAAQVKEQRKAAERAAEDLEDAVHLVERGYSFRDACVATGVSLGSLHRAHQATRRQDAA